MPVSIDVTPADKLDLVARTLRGLDEKDLQRELYRGLNRATRKLKDDAREEARDRLPSGGGLNDLVAKSRMSTRRQGGRNPGIRIQAGSRKEQQSLINAGEVRHPVFGNRDVWVTQQVTPGWFSDPMQAGKDEAAEAIEEVLDDVARQLAHRLDDDF